jgi:small subunit ribosomal protein S16
MSVAIRLKRTGKHNQPFYRVVAIERREAASGKPLEILGSYDPRALKIKDKITIKKDRYDHWIKVGAKPSETIASLIKTVERGEDRKKKEKKSRKLAAKEKAAKAEAEKADAKKEDAEAAQEAKTEEKKEG